MTALARDTFTDRPFGCPPDVVLDIPVPPSVNKARRIDWRNHRLTKAWHRHCSNLLMSTGQYKFAKNHKPAERYELTLILDESQTWIDLDNSVKLANDYLKRLGLIVDDGPKYCRRIVLEWGDAPHGCRLILKPWGEP